MLAENVDTLTKELEVEAKNMRREVAKRVGKEHENRSKQFTVLLELLRRKNN